MAGGVSHGGVSHIRATRPTARYKGTQWVFGGGAGWRRFTSGAKRFKACSDHTGSFDGAKFVPGTGNKDNVVGT